MTNFEGKFQTLIWLLYTFFMGFTVLERALQLQAAKYDKSKLA